MRESWTISKAERFWSSLGAIMRFHAVQQRELGTADELSELLEGDGSELLLAASLGGATVWDAVALLAGGKLSIIDQMKLVGLLVESGLDDREAYNQIARRLAEHAEQVIDQLRS